MASTSRMLQPVMAVLLASSTTTAVAPTVLAGASFTASMVIVVVALFCDPPGTFTAPSLTVKVIVRVVDAP